MRQFHLSFGLFLVLTTVNCSQNKRNPDDDRGFALRNESSRRSTSHFIIPGSNGLPHSWNSIDQPELYKPTTRQFAQEALAAHNKYRKTSPHYGTKLVLDGKLCRDAQRYADKLARRGGGVQHARGTGQGENLSGQGCSKVRRQAGQKRRWSSACKRDWTRRKPLW